MTPRRKLFDATFGIVFPILFVIVDPTVFRATDFAGIPSDAYLGLFKVFAYVSLAVAAIALGIVLRREKSSAFVAGLLWGAAMVAFAIGVALIPVSLLGIIFFGLGLLGFSPFLAAFVYARAARMRRSEYPAYWKSIAPGIVTFLVLGLSAQIATNRTVHWAVEHVTQPAASAVLRAAPLVFDPDQLVFDYQTEQREFRREQLAAAYLVMTGRNIKTRITALAD